MHRVLSRFVLPSALLLACVLTAVRGTTPTSAQVSINPSLGKLIYTSRCSLCHGMDGKGDGFAAPLLHPRPRDFTSGTYKFRSTESGSIPTDRDLEQTIRLGLPGTAMPAFDSFLRGDTLTATIAYVKSLSPRFSSERPKEVSPPAQVMPTSASIAAGRSLYEKFQCATCHGTAGDGVDATAKGLTDIWGSPEEPTNLREPWTFRGGSTADAIAMRLKTGVDGTPMPSFAQAATDRDLSALAEYIVSNARKPAWAMTADELKQFYAAQEKDRAANPVKRGEMLSRVLGCVSCHTALTDSGTFDESLRLAGGQRWTAGPYGDYFPSNLTPDTATGIGAWTDEELRNAITRGVGRKGERFLPMFMPWTAFANMSETDFSAIVAYLRSLKPIHNKIPAHQPRDIITYLVGKFKMLILHEDFPSVIHFGNAGSAGKTEGGAQ